MARKRGKMALYEVVGKGQFDSVNKAIESQASKAEPALKADSEKKNLAGSLWPTKPRVLQFNHGRVEFSLPVQIVAAVVLGILFICLVMFRLGQVFERKAGTGEQVTVVNPVVERRAEAVKPAVRVAEPVVRFREPVVVPAVPAVPAVLESQGSNNIVITQYGRQGDLEPVKAYFDGHGIETEIIRIGNDYCLRTKKKYENPAKSGTNGYYALKKVKEVGAGYKAPAGFESFGAQPFQDAYGKKFND